MIECLENEIWKDIAGYETLYKVSTMGRVKTSLQVQEQWISQCYIARKTNTIW